MERPSKAEESYHIKPAALKSFCNLASWAQTCASCTSESEGGPAGSPSFTPWSILAAVSSEIGFESPSREREKPCRNELG